MSTPEDDEADIDLSVDERTVEQVEREVERQVRYDKIKVALEEVVRDVLRESEE